MGLVGGALVTSGGGNISGASTQIHLTASQTIEFVHSRTTSHVGRVIPTSSQKHVESSQLYPALQFSTKSQVLASCNWFLTVGTLQDNNCQ